MSGNGTQGFNSYSAGQTNPSTPDSPSGPLSALYTNTTGYNFLNYPLDLLSQNRGGHYIQFFINANQSSQYTKNTNYVATGSMATPGTAAALQLKEGVNVSTNVNISGKNQFSNGTLTRPTKRILSAISLYMPDTMQTQYNANWEGESLTKAMGPIGAFAQGAKSAGKSLSSSGGALEVTGKLSQSLLGAGTESTDFMLYSGGLALNPQLEVLYKGLGFREFQFEFLFSPKSSAEAQAIKDIIKTFKFHMAPEIGSSAGDSARYFIMPSEFDIQFMFQGVENSNVNKISTCVLTNINVDYAPNGWATYNDGFPVQTRLTLQFKEVEYITKQRVDQGF